MFGQVMTALAAVTPLLIWLIGITFALGRMFERLQQHEARLNSGSETMKELREEQGDLQITMAEWKRDIANVGVHLKRIEAQNLKIWQALTPEQRGPRGHQYPPRPMREPEEDWR